ncbi:RNA-directed DNA polymerase from mobile element jockey-like [Brachionus plicatilis]|uniref:RNA-directed DNA polymerase from mobile element jockey-like n=1 Tax=Brachionus plicatilis TaxID=10195 RepID=A0A3M7PHL8_BRAPC|nr:RNA-directed DNA polymerase from mobile element jockey-like [Brachionus plicatilis]
MDELASNLNSLELHSIEPSNEKAAITLSQKKSPQLYHLGYYFKRSYACKETTKKNIKKDLIKELECKEIGTKIRGYFTGVVMYADDILLLTNNLKELQKALNICEKYGIQHEIKFNPEKTQYIVFGEKLKGLEAKPRMCDQEIKCVDKLRYLGVILNRNNNNKDQTDTNLWTRKLCFKQRTAKENSNSRGYDDKKNAQLKKNIKNN